MGLAVRFQLETSNPPDAATAYTGGTALPDATGRCGFALPAQSRHAARWSWQVRAHTPGYWPAEHTSDERIEPDTEIVLPVRRMPELRGWVVDRFGRGVDGVLLSIHRGDGGATGEPLVAAKSDPNGRWRTFVPHAGDIVLLAITKRTREASAVVPPATIRRAKVFRVAASRSRCAMRRRPSCRTSC